MTNCLFNIANLFIVATLLSATPLATVEAELTPCAGLVVQLGADDVRQPAALSRTGAHLVHVLETDAGKAGAAQTELATNGCYGLVSVEHVTGFAQLPYTENLVNHMILSRGGVPASEIFRVLTPGGTLVITRKGIMNRAKLESAGFDAITETGAALTARKPWPAEMDEWSHSRHAANGNAVSHDTMVGSPARIRWVAGATEEVEGVVTAGGRNFYGGVLARDSFNGLRLWHRDLGKARRNLGMFRLPRLGASQARPVASAKYVVAVEQGCLVTLDALTGELVRTFTGISQPRELLLCGKTVVACDMKSIAAFDAESAELLWRRESAGVCNLAAEGGTVAFTRRGLNDPSKDEAIALNIDSGEVKWCRPDCPWLEKVFRTVLHGKHLVFEVSSLNDHDVGNAIYVVDVATGELIWEKAYPPGMNHNRQARAMFIDDDLWILHGGKANTADKANLKRLPLEVHALDPATGQTRVTYPAGLAHCFPPAATANFIFSGVMDLTDLKTGKLLVNPITKANCSREYGWVPANGLIYTTPKHCTCWPILRGYVALAPLLSERDAPANGPLEKIRFALEKGPAYGKIVNSQSSIVNTEDWPLYRHDRWRSSSTTSPGPEKLLVLWSCSLTRAITLPDGPILHDWRENEFVKGPVSPPTIAGTLAFVARPDAHEVVAVEVGSGKVRWRFTANGRVDTPPTIYRGFCLFGTHAGSVYALHADSGRMAWHFRAAPSSDRIVAYGQVESPWPVPGTVLIINGVAYFAAGRQPFADGGIFIFAVDPISGRKHWVHRLDTIPQDGYYENSGLEFDPIDILHQEGDGIALSRWIISRDGKRVTVDKWNAFAKLNTGNGSVWVPRGCWTYGPRHQDRFRGEAPRRPLCTFRDRTVLSSFNGSTGLFRRDFDLENGEQFNSKWITGWEAARKGREGGTPFRTYRLAEKATWKADPFTPESGPDTTWAPGTQLTNEVYGMVLAGSGRLFVVHKDGRLKVVSAADGSVLAEKQVPPPVWDGMAIAGRRVYLASQSGELVCIGE
ncbi:MAG: outer membrane protein assembly factor BamB family protein [Planctomycetota bacterium]